MAILEAVATWSTANWDKLVAALGALAGILVAAVTIRAALVKRRRIVVNVRYSGAEARTIHITATNLGPRPIRLKTVGFIIPDGRAIAIRPTGPSFKVFKFDKEGQPIRLPKSSIDLPGDVEGEVPVDVWMGVESVQDLFVREGVRGKVRIRGFYNDALGHVYKSRKLDFDAGSQLRSRSIPPRPAAPP